MSRENDDFRIVLDDVKSTDTQKKQWAFDTHYTNKLIPQEIFQRLELDEKELADFWYAILARLHAFNEGGEI